MSLVLRHGFLLAGLLMIGLSCALVTGCGGSTSTPTPAATLSFNTTIDDPSSATPGNYASATVKPADPNAGVLSMPAPVISATNGSSVVSPGAESLLQVDLGNTGVISGTLPLSQQTDQVGSSASAILTAGDSAFSLSPQTEIDVVDTGLSALGVHGSPQGLRITSFKVLFSVHPGPVATWTLPTTFKLDLEKRQKMYVLADSYLKLRWQGRLDVPPADGKVKLSVNLYNNVMEVAGPLVQTVPVNSKAAVLTGHNNIEFSRVEMVADFRDVKN